MSFPVSLGMLSAFRLSDGMFPSSQQPFLLFVGFDLHLPYNDLLLLRKNESLEAWGRGQGGVTVG
jgi:hypothetical protein